MAFATEKSFGAPADSMCFPKDFGAFLQRQKIHSFLQIFQCYQPISRQLLQFIVVIHKISIIRKYKKKEKSNYERRRPENVAFVCQGKNVTRAALRHLQISQHEQSARTLVCPDFCPLPFDWCCCCCDPLILLATFGFFL